MQKDNGQIKQDIRDEKREMVEMADHNAYSAPCSENNPLLRFQQAILAKKNNQPIKK